MAGDRRVGYAAPDEPPDDEGATGMICPRCGTENAAGDAFCGNCGAFLEFAIEEAAEPAGPSEAATAGTSEPAVPSAETLAGTAAMPPPASAPAPAPPPSAGATGTVPAAAAAATAPPAAPGGPTCPACGRANPAGRTFCISCGERLPSVGGAGGGRATGRAPAAAAVPSTPVGGASQPPTPATTPAPPARPAWDFPTAPVPTPATPPAGVPPADAREGRSRLPLIGAAVVALALIGGGAFVVLGGGIGGGPRASSLPSAPATGAAGDVSPSAEPSPEPTTAATEAPPSASPTEAPTVVPTIPPGPSVGIKITGAKASSQLKAERAPKLVFDGSPATTWKSASGKFLGAWLEVRFAPAAITRIQIWTGWQKSEPLFFGNHRPQNVTVSFDGGDPVPLTLQDVMGAQRVDIPPKLGIVHATRLRITIADVYPARATTAKDSPTTEVAISEIRLFGIPVTP